MFYSAKHNILFIASPKTGTVSVQEALQKLDADGERHFITLSDRQISNADTHYGVIGHARAWELEKAMGKEDFAKLDTIAFIRNPYAKLVSSYFYNRKGSLKRVFGMKGNKRLFLRMINSFLTKLVPKILPFQLWALLYPMKSNLEYVANRQGDRIVKHIGRTEFLSEDFQKILIRLNIEQEGVEIFRRNVSSHDHFEKYYTNRWFKNIISKRYADDIAFYESIYQEMEEPKA